MKQIDSLVGACIQKGYVTQEKAPWLRYALERRITTLVTFTLLLIIGLLITDPATLLAFFISFCSLRSRTNGFHARSFGRCFLDSLLGEVFYLGALPMLWNDTIAFAALIVSIMIIWVLAPYNHPSMDLSPKEVIACARSAKFRLSVLVFALSVLHVLKQEQLAKGGMLGVAMTASTLAMAYCSPKTMPKEKGLESKQN